MIKSNSILTILSTTSLFLLTTTFQKITEPKKYHGICPEKSCLRCQGYSTNMDCTKCQHLVTDAENKTCGIKIKNAPEYYGISNDLIYKCEGLEVRSYSARCFLCQTGYALSYEGKCKKVYKKNCKLQSQILMEIPMFGSDKNKIEGKSRKVELELCLVCDKSFPNIVMLKDFQHNTEKDYGDCRDQLDQSEFPNCKYGTMIEENGKMVKKCAACDKDNYSVDVETGQCDLFPRDMLGCMRMRKGECLVCNHYRGYFMVGPGYCKKIGRILKGFWVVLSVVFFFACLVG